MERKFQCFKASSQQLNTDEQKMAADGGKNDFQFTTLIPPPPLSGFQASYLKESETRVRNAETFPLSTLMSIFVTSATRKSRSDVAAVSTARRPASSHDVLLTPTTSTIL
jgi:hypothetical protein